MRVKNCIQFYFSLFLAKLFFSLFLTFHARSIFSLCQTISDLIGKKAHRVAVQSAVLYSFKETLAIPLSRCLSHRCVSIEPTTSAEGRTIIAYKQVKPDNNCKYVSFFVPVSAVEFLIVAIITINILCNYVHDSFSHFFSPSIHNATNDKLILKRERKK